MAAQGKIRRWSDLEAHGVTFTSIVEADLVEPALVPVSSRNPEGPMVRPAQFRVWVEARGLSAAQMPVDRARELATDFAAAADAADELLVEVKALIARLVPALQPPPAELLGDDQGDDDDDDDEDEADPEAR